MLHEGRRITHMREFGDDMCRRVVEAGIPLWRAFCGIRTLHPEIAASAYVWRRGQGTAERRTAMHGVEKTPAFTQSPLAEVTRTGRTMRGLTAQVVREDYSVLEDPSFATGIQDGTLHVDRFTPGRAAIVALTMAQSAAMEYYERIVEALFERTNVLVERLEKKGTVPYRTRPLHRFIGEAITTRSEVLSILHLLDKPDATWDDPAMDHIYNDLRAEFDLVDRYGALELKLRSIQEALELVLDVARDRRLVTLEIVVAVLILIEIGLAAAPFI
jgi:hypothetical protein